MEARAHGVIGRGVKNCYINEIGHLIFVMTDGNEIDVGFIGQRGVITGFVVNDDGSLTINYDNGNSETISSDILYSVLNADNVHIPPETAEALGIVGIYNPTVDDALNALKAMIEAGSGSQETDLTGAVRYDKEQTLTDEEKAQALANLGLDQPAADGGCIKYDAVQDLAETQKARARSNIGAVSSSEVTDAIQSALNQQLGDYAVSLAALDEVIGGE